MQHTDMPIREKSIRPPQPPTDEPTPTPSPSDTDIHAAQEREIPHIGPYTPDAAQAEPIPVVLPDVESHAKEPQAAEAAVVSDKGARILPVLAFILRLTALFLCVLGGTVFLLTAYFRVETLFTGDTAVQVLGELAGGADMIQAERIVPPSVSDEPGTALPPLVGLSTVPANEAETGRAGYAPDTTERITEDLSSRAKDGLGLINETPYTPDLGALAEAPLPIRGQRELAERYGADAPLCLILHTHGTEGYLDSAGTGFHTADKEKSVIRLGAEMAAVLTENGIPTIHCDTAFDENRFDSAYYNASLWIRETLAQYPSIRYIFDIHRDAIEWTDAGGEVCGVAPYTEIDGVGTAQLMFVVGTDHGGSGHTGWQDNLTFAAHLQKSLTARYPGLCRDINLRSASFNEQYTQGSLLIEAGAASSTMEEALCALRYLAQEAAAVIRRENIT